jgi:hypothetical protein
MSDADLLLDEAVEFPREGEQPWAFAACDLETELRFQAEHQRWARNQLETMKAGVAAAAYHAALDVHVEHVEGNRFAFGGGLSLAFLTTDQGLAEYLILLAGKANCRAVTREKLAALRRRDRPAWDELAGRVLRRDFPNLFAAPEASSSAAPATPSPSTTESSSCSPGSPG